MKFTEWSEDEAKVRFFSRVKREGRCLLWTGTKNQVGYGVFMPGKRFGGSVRVHRVAWFWQKGPIPEDMELDHMCRNRACVNVGHLKRVPKGWNRAQGSASRRRDICARGHLRTRDNLDSGGKCKQCNNIVHMQRYYKRKLSRESQ
jgi:hypothetical protein